MYYKIWNTSRLLPLLILTNFSEQCIHRWHDQHSSLSVLMTWPTLLSFKDLVLFTLSLMLIKLKLLSRVWLFATLWTVAHQTPPSMEFSRQEYWSGLPFPSPGDLPKQGLNLGLPHCGQTLYHLSHQGIPKKWKLLSHVGLFVTPWAIQSMEFSRPEYWSG